MLATHQFFKFVLFFFPHRFDYSKAETRERRIRVSRWGSGGLEREGEVRLIVSFDLLGSCAWGVKSPPVCPYLSNGGVPRHM
jgi:hypothetical protein